MKRLLLLPLLVLCALSSSAQENAPPAAEVAPQADAPAAPPASLEERLKANPGDKSLFDQYMIANLMALRELIRTDAAAAQARIDAMRQFIDSLEPATEEGKQLVQRGRAACDYQSEQIEVARVSQADLEQRIRDNPNDAKAVGMYQSKLVQELAPLARGDAVRADAQLKAAQEFLASIRDKAEDPAAKTAHEQITRSLGSLERMIASGLRLAKLIGSDAAPLDVEAWVNGEPLAEADLKGKVVLLDFWAVWCGPCIATFPHLREWQEKYADKGLVIIGLTRYYNMVWDEESGRAKRLSGQEKATPEQEQEMLRKFAESHQLQHRFAIQKENVLSEFYGVTGIPHAVVIDRENKVRLIRVGSGEQNAKDIEELIARLVGEAGSS